MASTEHLTYAKHMTAEHQVEDWSPEDGTVIRWKALNRKNHYLDSTMLACVAGHGAGVRLEQPAPVIDSSAPMMNEDGDVVWDRFHGKW